MNRTSLLLITTAPFVLALGACAHAPKGPSVEVVYQASTDISDDGSQINGKLCFGETHFDRSNLANPPGAIDLLGWNRHFVIVPVNPTKNYIKGAIASREAGRAHISLGAKSEESRRNALEAPGGGRGTEENEAVELVYGPDELKGRVGWHQFSVKNVGDHMEGKYQYTGAMAPVNLKLWGMDKLWALPLPEQGVLLPSLLHCLQKFPTRDFEMTLADLTRKS